MEICPLLFLIKTIFKRRDIVRSSYFSLASRVSRDLFFIFFVFVFPYSYTGNSNSPRIRFARSITRNNIRHSRRAKLLARLYLLRTAENAFREAQKQKK